MNESDDELDKDGDSQDGNIANIFCFGAFADKHTGTLYTDQTGKFPHISLDGNQCFFIAYHYETNAIIARPIAALDGNTIYEEYKQVFGYISSKG